MAPSFDCAISSLFCAEDNDSVLIDNDCFLGFESTTPWTHRNHRNLNQNRVFGLDLGIPLPLQTQECLDLMFEKENQHMPCSDYLKRLEIGDLDVAARTEAIDWIGKVHAHFGFGPLSSYLSINYLDRFLSSYELPKGKPWTMQLLAVACLSLAAKMEENEVPLSLDLQVGESKFVFEARTIQRMELLVLSTLKWRMQAITPFSFLDYFLRKLNDDDQILHQDSILRSTHLILCLNKGIGFLQFKPSEIAAAVAISVAAETKTVDAEKAISVLAQYLEMGKVFKCMEMVNALVGGGASGPVSSVPPSPIGVLDAACLSYKSDDTTVGSCSNSSQHNTPVTKRRRLNSEYREVEL